MQVNHMMFIVEKGDDCVRVRNDNGTVYHYQYPLKKDHSDGDLRKAIKECMSWAIENAPLNSVYIINANV